VSAARVMNESKEQRRMGRDVSCGFTHNKTIGQFQMRLRIMLCDAECRAFEPPTLKKHINVISVPRVQPLGRNIKYKVYLYLLGK
jgi:hypothetical protein